MEQQKIYKKAIKIYGEESQITMIFEEMSELQKELCKYLRGKSNKDAIAEEIADVEIMLAQARIIFNINDEVVDNINKKVIRLNQRLLEAMGH